MNRNKQVTYRLRLGSGFLDEARQDIDLKRWRSAMDNSQLVVENAAKAVLSVLGPVGRTHFPATLLRSSLATNAWPDAIVPDVERLAQLTELLGFDVHMQTDYGDEADGLTPWELFDEEDARRALEIAEEAFGLATMITHHHDSLPNDTGDAIA